MKKLVALLLLVSGVAFADHEVEVPFGIDYDLTKAPMLADGYTKWCFINFEKDHWDFDEEQAKTARSRVAISIPDGATAVQLTGKSPRKCFCNEGSEFASIPNEPRVVRRRSQLRFQVQYSGDPWKLFIGWKFDGKVTKRGRVSQCHAIVLHPGADVDEWEPNWPNE